MRLKRPVCARNSSQGAAVARACTVKRGATMADLASEFLARMSVSAGTGSSVVVVPTPTNPAGIRRCARDLKTWSASKKAHQCRARRQSRSWRQKACGKKVRVQVWQQNSWRGCRAALDQVVAWSWSLRLRIQRGSGSVREI